MTAHPDRADFRPAHQAARRACLRQGRHRGSAQRCVAELNRFRPRPDVVVISGDLADTPVAEEYEHSSALAPLEIGFVAVPGNHDGRDMMRAALPRVPGRLRATVGRSIRAGGRSLDLIRLDSSVRGKPNGGLDGATLEWLDAKLASWSTRPALIFLHHPPFITGIGHMDVQNLHNTEALARICCIHARVWWPPATSTAGRDAIRWRPDDDLPGAEPCGGPRSRRNFRHPSKWSRRPFICMPGLPVKASAI